MKRKYPYVIRADIYAKGLGYVTYTLATNGRLYLATNEPLGFASVKVAKRYWRGNATTLLTAFDETPSNPHKFFIEGPRKGVYNIHG